MTFLPIVGRHLRVVARLNRTYRGRIVAVLACFLPAIWVTIVAYSNLPLSEQGIQMFNILSYVLFFYCLFAGAQLTADCLSEEKREGTLGLLFLTDLKGYDIVFGKLVASSLASLYQLLAVLPIIGLALLLGGITGLQFSRTILVLVNTLFFSLSVGIFVSTVSLRERKALFAAAFLIALLTVIPYVLAEHFAYNNQRGTTFQLNLGFAVPSPYFAFDLAHSPAKAAVLFSDLYRSLLISHLTAWCFLILASALLPRVCHQRPDGALLARCRAKFQIWCYGSERVRRALRSRLLDRNPFFWLASRDYVKRMYPWLLLGVSGAAWWAGYFVYSDLLHDWEPSFVLLMIIHGVFKIWIASEVCARFAEDRRHGAWELLLSSPLSIRQILAGEKLALRRQFGWPIAVLFVTDLLLLRAASGSSLYITSRGSVITLFLCMMSMLWIDSHTLKWVGIWRALRGQTLNQSLIYSLSRILILPSAAWLVYWYTFVLQAGLPATINAFTISWFGLGLAVDIFFWSYARLVVTKHFRALAAGQKEERVSALPSPSLRFLRSRRVVAAILVLAGTSAGLASYHYSLRRQLRTSIGVIQRGRYPITAQQLDEWHHPISAQENAALEINQAIRLTTQINFRVHNFDYSIHPALPDDLQKAELTSMIAANRPVLDHLHLASTLTNSRFPVQWSMGLDTPLAYLGPSRGLAELAAADALVHLANGDSGNALASFQAILTVARSLANEPTPIAQLVRARIIETAHSSLEHLLNHARLSDEQLEQLARSLSGAEIDNETGLLRGFIGLRCLGIDLGLMPPREFVRLAFSGFNNTQANIYRAIFPLLNITGAHERDLLFFLNRMNAYCEAAETPFPSRLEKYRAIGETIKKTVNSHPTFYVCGFLLSVVGNTPNIQAETCARIRICELAVAIERYRVRERKLPQTLKSLGNLIDPFTGQPIRYKRLDAGYVVYSFGKNDVDNGGDPSLDIVFTVQH